MLPFTARATQCITTPSIVKLEYEVTSDICMLSWDLSEISSVRDDQFANCWVPSPKLRSNLWDIATNLRMKYFVDSQKAFIRQDRGDRFGLSCAKVCVKL